MKKGLLFILLAAASVCLPAQEKENEIGRASCRERV